MGDVGTFLLTGFASIVGTAVLVARPTDVVPPSPPSASMAMAETTAARQALGSARTIRIDRASDGLFYLNARINGVTVRFLVDSGASIVVLKPADAARAGIQAVSSTEVRTAAGVSTMSMARAGVTLNGREIENIAAAVPSGDIAVSLLGQNVLAELGRVSMTRTQLTIEAEGGENNGNASLSTRAVSAAR